MKATVRIDELSIANGVSDEHSRPILECVRIGDGKMVTADGFMLVVKRVGTEGEGNILIQGDTLLKAQQLLEHGMCTIQSDGKNVAIKSAGTPTPIIADLLYEGEFPKYEGLYPAGKPTAQIAVGVNLLKRLLKCLPVDAPMIQFRIRKGEGTPIEFVAGETSGLIMPMFVGVENEYWHKPERQIKKGRRIAHPKKKGKD